MATPSHARAVKSLNTSAGSKRFVFKSFAQRIEEIDIGENVFRSLVPLDAEPSPGSTFFRDCLLKWREENTAEDFISFYEEVMPWVQTLPQILLHKETIMSKLLSRLQVQARLSLEPILCLIVALSRDLLKDFLPFLKRITEALVNLLENGAAREPEVMEQIFTSWPFIMMYLKKYLIQDIAEFLKITRSLRYYHKDYVEEFMAESVSFLLRNAPDKQLVKGIREIMQEVVKKPTHVRKSGASALLWHIMKGSSSRFHSRADRVLRLLTSSCMVSIGGEEGSLTPVEVVTASFQRACEELPPMELKLMWDCLLDEISISIDDGKLLHLSHMLSLLISCIQFCKEGKISEYEPLLELVKSLVQKYMKLGNAAAEEYFDEVVEKVPQLILCLVDGVFSTSDPSAITSISLEWTPVFGKQNKNLTNFIRELIQKDQCVLNALRSNILSAMDPLIDLSPPEEVIYLMMTFFERLSGTSGFSVEVSKEKFPRVCCFLQESITLAINDIACGDLSTLPFNGSRLALLWGVLSCYSHISNLEANPTMIMDLVYALDQLPIIDADEVAGIPKSTWQSLVGASLASYLKLQLKEKLSLAEKTKAFLDLAQKYKSSSAVLFSVAEFLDSVHGSPSEAASMCGTIHPELEAANAIKAIGIFSNNLSLPEDAIRISTLRILRHYEPLDGRVCESEEPAQKKLKTEAFQSCNKNADCSNVIQLLLSIETTPLSVSTSRKVVLLISQIQMGLSAGRFSEVYVPLLLNGVIGIFHKRFSPLWKPAQECLAVLIEKYVGIVWDKLVSYLEQCQLQFFAPGIHLGRGNDDYSNKSSDLLDCFNAFLNPDTDRTPCTTVLSLLLQSLQTVLSVTESKSRRLVPLFLKFLGYNNDSVRDCEVGLYNLHCCKGKEWRCVLKEWLNLFKLLRNPRSLYRGEILKEVLFKRLLDETDAEIQLKVLDCLLNWKDAFLLPYDQHLKNLIASKNLQEELATWSLAKESHQIEDMHRGYLIPLVTRLLIPKVRNLKALTSSKNASGKHRKALLRFLAQLEINELTLFFALLIKPLQLIPSDEKENEVLNKWFWSSCEISLEEFQACNILEIFTVKKVLEIPLKTRSSFLHVFEDILKSFDEFHLRPFLNQLMSLLFRILESFTLALDGCKSNDSFKGPNLSKENLIPQTAVDEVDENITAMKSIKKLKRLRSLCLAIVSLVLVKYKDHDFGSLWDIFFTSVKALIDGFKHECASSKEPSSLFSCFLEMSESHTTVSLLLREEGLVPTIFSVLTVKTASKKITDSVLKFIENLLNLDSDLESYPDLTMNSVILPNLGPLMNSLHSFFQCHNDSRRKFVKSPGKTELRIFKLLSKYISDPLSATKFVDILLPFLSKKAHNSDEFLDVLHVIRDMVPRLGSAESTGKILKAVAPLLISSGLNVRLSICDLLEGLALNDPSLGSLAKLVRELNAISSSEIDELDYETRVDAYERVGQNSFSTVREDHALVILSHAVYDMSSEDMILRQSAYRLLVSFIQFSALILDAEVNDRQEMPEPLVLETHACWTKVCIQRIIKTFFLKHMGEAMHKGIVVQREWISVLRDMVLRLTGIPSLNSIKELCSRDAEVDFFNNILHLQIHRRAKALTRFRKAIDSADFSEAITKEIFVPLFFKMLFDVQDGHHEHLRNACLESLAAISGHMQWESYHAFLLKCFQEMTLKPDKQRVLLRLICYVLDQFHFKDTSINQGKEANACEIGNPDKNGMGSLTKLPVDSSDFFSKIQDHLRKTVLPKIEKLLSADSDKVNVTINLAALKLLKLLPVDTLEAKLPNILHCICNFLKNRLESIRDEARNALAACCKELGLEYLQFIVKTLRATLKRGYELHVLGYTLHYILSKALLTPSSGRLDYCLEELLSVAENDILGDVAEEKEVEKIASKMKETRKPKSFGTLKLIAESITFKTHALKLLSPVKAHLHKHLTPKLKAKLEKMLEHIAEGIKCNPSVDHTDLFIFVYGLIEDGIAEENLLGKASLSVKSDKQLKNGVTDKRSSPWIIGYKSQSSHLITVFSLQVLNNRLESMKFDKKDEQLLSMLDPFVKLLGEGLSSKFQDLLAAALKCLVQLIRLPLPSLENHADNIKTLVLDIAQKSGNTNSRLLQSSLKLLRVLLQSTKITLSNDETHMLIQCPLFIDLERNPSSLLLLKAIVSRKIVVPEIFDIVTRVAELMVTSQDESIRKKCSQILLRFLLDYQLSKKRLQQHLDFLLSNLSYEHSTGREAVLEMLHAIIIKFPKHAVDEQAQTFFIHLVVCLANDQDSKVRSMVGAALKLLIGRTSQNALSTILEYSLSWYVGEKQNLWSAAAQVLGLLVEVLKKGFRRHIQNALPVMKSILKSALSAVTSDPSKYSTEAMVPFWREAYYSLVLLEKLVVHFPDLYFEKDVEDIWDAICQFLLYPHMWIRNISSRLVASYFAAVSLSSQENGENLKLEAFLLMKPSRLFSIAVSVCCQLKAQLTDDTVLTLITQNLVFSISGVHSLAGHKKWKGLQEFWSSLETHEQGHFVKAFQLLGSKKGAFILASLSGESAQDVEGSVQVLQSLLVSPLLKRLGKIALQMGDIQMKIVFNCFRTISSQIGQEGSQQYAYDLLLPLYKVCEGFAGKVIADDVKQLAEEVRESLKGTLGVENFVKAYNEVRKNLKAKRDKRKRQEKLLPVINPTRHAKRKQRITAKHSAHKKRKIMTMKQQRWNA